MPWMPVSSFSRLASLLKAIQKTWTWSWITNFSVWKPITEKNPFSMVVYVKPKRYDRPFSNLLLNFAFRDSLIAKASECAQKDSGVSLSCKVDKQSCGRARRRRPSDQLAGWLLPSTLTTHDQKWRTIPRLLLELSCQDVWKLLLAFANATTDRRKGRKLGSEFTSEEDQTKCIRFMEYSLHIRAFSESLTAIWTKLLTFSLVERSSWLTNLNMSVAEACGCVLGSWSD